MKKFFSIILILFFIQNIVFADCSMEEPFIIEHLEQHKGSTVNIVKITPTAAVILPHNILKITFNSDFNSKTVQCGDIIDFCLEDGLSTREGRCLLPSCTKIIGTIKYIEKPKWMNRNAKVCIVFDKINLPDGRTINICALPYAKNNELKKSTLSAVGKAAAYTVGMFGIGTGLGAAIGSACLGHIGNAVGIGAMAFGMPIGGGVGLILGAFTPGLHYKVKAGTPIYIELEQPLALCR